MRNKARIIIAFLVSLVFTITSGANSSPANAVGEITAFRPLTNSAYFGDTLFEAGTSTYVANANSRTITLTLESDPSITRTVTTTLGTGLQQITFNPLATDSNLLSNIKVAAVSSSLGATTAYPNGIYKVTFSWQYSLSGTQTRTQDVLHVSLNANCVAGSYAATGTTGCTLAALGYFVGEAGSTSSTICPAGRYAVNEGSTTCEPAEPGKYSAAGTGNLLPTDCPAGTYQPLSGQSTCSPARAGHFVDRTGQWQDFECEPGTFVLDTGQTSCLDAPAGTYVAAAGEHASMDCVKGTYSANARSTSCTQAPANFYVATVAAIAATPCPSGQVSDAGSDEVSDCHVPVVAPATVAPATKTQPSMTKGQKRSLKSIAIEIGMNVPAKAKVTGTLDRASKKLCKVSGANLKASKAGSCNLKLKVKPKKGSATTKATTITVN